MSDLDLETLREVAEAATDGPWVAERFEMDLEWWVSCEAYGLLFNTGYVGNNESRPNAEHIAAFDPPTALALLDRIDRLTESNRKLANQIVGYGDRVQESVRSIQAEAWDKGAFDASMSLDHGGHNADNPFRSEPTTNH